MENSAIGRGFTKSAVAVFLCLLMLISSAPAQLVYAFTEEDIIAPLQTADRASASDERLELGFNKGWKFNLGEVTAATARAFDDSSWDSVTLPHDFSITQDFTNTGTEVESGNLPGGTGWYRKMFVLPVEYAGKSVILNFDGAYNHTYVYINGKYVGENHYGYNSFSFDVTDYVDCNSVTQNILAVKVQSISPSSRWYSGAGINRDVTITIVNPVHISLNGTQVTSPNLSTDPTDGTLSQTVTLQNDGLIEKSVTINSEIRDDSGNTVGTAASANASLAAGSSSSASLSLALDNPTLWDIDNPYLYTVHTEVLDGTTMVDTYDTDFGYRYVEWDTDTGFSLNGTAMKLKGFCMHHDQGALGAVQEYDAIYRQLTILREMGCNAIRTSHNTTSKALIKACNELGLLVMEEFFDGWAGAKNGNTKDFSEYFNRTISSENGIMDKTDGETWAEFVVTQTVKRDRNDPCVFIWDAANELNQGSQTNNDTYAANIRSWVRALDTTRMLTQGNNTSAIMSVDTYMDVIGTNYHPAAWVTLQSNGRITKPLVGTEIASSTNSRGVYSITSSNGTMHQCTSYDSCCVGWGDYAARAWNYTITNDWFSGEFVWTGFDYIGEPTPWNGVGAGGSTIPNSSYFGIVDTAGFAKDSYYLYRSWWQDKDTTAHLLPGTWNRASLSVDSNGYVNVAAYSNAAKIELYLNGTLVGTATATTNTTPAGYTYQTWTESVNNASKCKISDPLYTDIGADLYPQFQVLYETGTLSIKAYDENNALITNTVGTDSVTTNTAARIVSNVWGSGTVTADGESFAYVEFEAQDADGNFSNDYNGPIHITVTGNGTIAGVDNGNAATTEKFQQSSVITSDKTATIELFNGRALAIVRTNETYGNISVTAVNSLPVTGSTVTSVVETGDKLTDEFEEVVIQDAVAYTPSQYDEYELIAAQIAQLSPVSADGTYELYSAHYEDASTGELPTVTFSASTYKGGFDKTEVLFDGLTPDTETANDVIWTGVDQAAGQYIQAELPEAVTMDSITVSAPTHRASSSTAVVEISLDGTAWTTVGDYTHTQAEALAAPINETYNFTETSVKYIRVRLTETRSGYYFILSEIAASLDGAAIDLSPASQVYLPSGTYVLTGAATNNYAKGVMTNADHTGGGLLADGSTGTPAATSDTWIFERQNDGTYYIYYYNNGSKYYINLGTASASLSTSMTAQALNVTLNETNNTIIIGNGSQYVNYFGQGTNRVASWSSGTALTVYTVSGTTVTQWTTATETPPVEDGAYVVYNLNYVMSTTASATSGRYERGESTLSGTTLSTSESNELNFTHISGNQYYITNTSGQYLNIGTSNGSLSYSTTPQEITVESNSSGKVFIYRGSQFIDHYTSNAVFSTWSSSVAGNKSNEVFTLYRKNGSSTGSSDAQAELYTALSSGISYNPGIYSKATYQALLDALASGYSIFNSADATDADYTAAKTAIDVAIAELLVDTKKFDATIYKYGYNPTAASPYSPGGMDYNTQSLAAMEAAIRASTSLMSQIKALIDYDGVSTAWAEGYADTALDSVIAAYAKIYTLIFTGYTVGGTTGNHPAEYKTCWNYWTKANTQGASEVKNEGASVQGLFSSELNADWLPESHAAYTEALPYVNSSAGALTNISLTLNVDASATSSVTLTPLTDISVYVPDFFGKEDVAGESSGYSKYHWNVGFPFIMKTDEYGVNDYEYDSSSDTYLFQASYTDETHTATAELTQVDSWSIRQANASNDTGKGLFPFNYQTGVTSYTGENAIYHYGLSFFTDFYIPPTGRYSNGKDIVFSFSGDDDVLVYVDGVLVLDNGGLHGARSCSINFTNCSVSYQYALNAAQGATVFSTVENDVTYTYGAENPGISADNQAALEKLYEVLNDTDEHNFEFFYLERGSTESNCKITFNLQQVSDDVKLIEQTLVADYGLPISYDITENNIMTSLAEDKGATVTYIGVIDGNNLPEQVVAFQEPANLVRIPQTGVLNRQEDYGSCTFDRNGNIVYTINSMEFSGSDSMYVCAMVENDPTYEAGSVYYAYEKLTIVPATTVYYEDDFPNGITYTDGTAATNFDNTETGYGAWQTVTDGTAQPYQAADLAGDAAANTYGYDPSYTDFSSYSNASAKKVTVSTKNNPNSVFSGGTGGSWPKASFTFTGTGFDLISLTDCTTGAISVQVYPGSQATGSPIRKHVVDTYYGYSYGRLYADENGEPTSTVTAVPLYTTENGKCTTTVKYYGANGKVTSAVSYYDVSGNGYTSQTTYYSASGMGYTYNATYYTPEDALVEDDGTGIPADCTPAYAYAYAYAYGWVSDENSDTSSLYQIPVIKLEGLDYGTYTAVITPTFTTMFNHYSTDTVGTQEVKNYSFYLDAVRIYNPAGYGANVTESAISSVYKSDLEAFPDYYELKDMLIGSDSLGTDAAQGVIFVDGIAACDNDLEKYKQVGPNNELYLQQGQAIAFEIWTTAVPVDVQLSAKLVSGAPKLSLTYGVNSPEVTLNTATDMYYSLNSLLPVGGKLVWTQITGSDGMPYYTTGTIVLQNSALENVNSVLSITNIKWTFASTGGQGHYRIPVVPLVENAVLMASPVTVSRAYSLMAMTHSDLGISDDDVSVNDNNLTAGEDVVLTVNTSEDVYTLVIRDADGNTVAPESIENTVKTIDDDNVKQWTVTLGAADEGTYTYYISGTYENGYESDNPPAVITVTVAGVQAEETEATQTSDNQQNENADGEESSFLKTLSGFFSTLMSFLEKLFAILRLN